ncbi:NAD(P)H-dependent oxidoreductase [Compostibacter hankyongensis]|uniref:NADPH-dependent FMN reductase-like domain-containing protein n=1 Tax=Compostibacter hankyongensis TaxID=1007089 RepID=A0ABP8FJB1_9BACT
MICIVVGTNRPGSKSRKVAEFYQHLLKGFSAESQILDLSGLPEDFIVSALYHNCGKNEKFNEIRKEIEVADKYIFVLPEYNNSVPGVFKAFIDGMSYPNTFVYKKCALVGISDGTSGNALGLSHITDVFNYLGMHVLALKVRIPFMKKNFVEGEITDDFIRKLIHDQAQQLIAF